MIFPRFILAAALMAASALGQGAMQCTFNAAVTPTIRGEGLAEQTGDVVVGCTGGTPTANGQIIPQVNITVTLNTNVTSRLTLNPYSEVLLILDEPHSPSNPSIPLSVCDPNNVSSAICSILGNGTGQGIYNGSTGHPNVFQGRVIAANQVLFLAVPIDPPGASGNRILRITNIRANASLLGISSTLVPTQVVASIGVSPSAALPLTNSDVTVAFIIAGSTAAVSTPPAIGTCSGANTAIYGDPSAPLGGGARDGQQFSVVISEGFPPAWKEKNIAVHLANPALPPSFPSDASQDVPGSNYFSESGFEAIGVTPSGSVPPGYGPYYPAGSAFPSVRGLNLAGTADQGTRFYLQFTGIPSGVKLFVPVIVSPTSVGLGTPSGTAVLVVGNSSPPFSPVSQNSAGLVSLPVTSGVATAVYEIAYANPFDTERLTVPVAVAFSAGQSAMGTVSVSAGIGPWSSTGTSGVGVTIPRFSAPASPIPAFSVTTCAPVLAVQKTHGGSFTQGQRGATYSVTVSNGPSGGPTSGTVTLTESLPDGLTLVSMTGTGWTCGGMSCSRSDALAAGASYPAVTVTVDVSSNASSPQVNSVSVSGGGGTTANATDSTVILTGGTPGPDPSLALSFFPITPCRVADTRTSQGKTGVFGPPFLSAYSSRDFPITSSPCAIPSTARAFSLNMTVVPPAALDFLSAYPAGDSYPGVSTLNSPAGTVIANAAIVPAGTNGAITVVAGQRTEAIIDANGYFAPPATAELLFYPMTPCRVVDTRVGQGKSGLFGPPALVANITRDIPMFSGTCNIPGTAQAFALNVTVVPSGGLGYLSLWPAGMGFPGVSTLNSPDGSIVANAAIVRAGSNGAISAFASSATDLIVDINGYFAPPANGGLHFYAMTPCRVADTRTSQGKTGSFGPPALAGTVARNFPITGSGCNVPGAAQAYSLNVTAVPPGPLDFLSIWPTGQSYPGVSTLNSPAGRTIANAAIVPAGSSGAITVVAGRGTDFIIDINGFFAP